MDRLVARAVSASLPAEIDVATLARCLDGRADPAAWTAHLLAFFTELRVEVIEAFLAAHGIAARDAASAYGHVTAATGERSADVDAWLESMADAAR